tara:strand:- start:5 stop:316 length:312 start_codon:yes stop_codon:yes gene_type:complete
MAITYFGLVQLGYEADVDFIIEDAGEGLYMKSWLSSDAQPTVSAIEAADVAWHTAWDAQEYARLRKAKYDLLNQDEMRFDDVTNSTTTWVDAINAIKTAHPKP